MLVLSNFFFCHYVFKRPSAAEALERVYMRKRVKRPAFEAALYNYTTETVRIVR